MKLFKQLVTSYSTIRTLVGAHLDLLNKLQVQSKDSAGNVITKNVPFMYTSKEKALMFEGVSLDQLKTGNLNILPRGTLSLVSIQKDDSRQLNRNLRTNKVTKTDTIEYQYMSVAYNFMFEVGIVCRGMNEACFLVEEIAPMFNPLVNIDIYDTANLEEPTRLPLHMLDISIEEMSEINETSKNLFRVVFSTQIDGYLYPPTREDYKIKQLNLTFGSRNKVFSVPGFDLVSDSFDDTLEFKGFSLEHLTAGCNNGLKLLYRTKLSDNVTCKWDVEHANITSSYGTELGLYVPSNAKMVNVTVHITYNGKTQVIERTFDVMPNDYAAAYTKAEIMRNAD